MVQLLQVQVREHLLVVGSESMHLLFWFLFLEILLLLLVTLEVRLCLKSLVTG